MDLNGVEMANEVELAESCAANGDHEASLLCADIPHLKENASVQMSDEVSGWQTLEQQQQEQQLQQEDLPEDNETENTESTNGTTESNTDAWQNGGSGQDPTETGPDTLCTAAGEAFTQHSIQTPSEYQPAVASADIATPDEVSATESEGLRTPNGGYSAAGLDVGSYGDATDGEPIVAIELDEECGERQETVTASDADGSLCHENEISSEYGGLTSSPTSDDVETRDAALADRQSAPDVEIPTAEAERVIAVEHSSTQAEESLPIENDSAIGDVEQLTSEVGQADSPSEDRSTSGASEVVVVGGSDSAAVTPMDEYRHLLRQQEDADTTLADYETQPEVHVRDVMSTADDNRVDHVSSSVNGEELMTDDGGDVIPAAMDTECDQPSDHVTPDVGRDAATDDVTVSSSTTVENDFPVASPDAAQFTSSAGDFVPVEVPEEQQQQSPLTPSHSSSTVDYLTNTSSTGPETNVGIEQSQLFQTSSPPVSTLTETATSPTTQSGSTPPLAEDSTVHPTPSITDRPEATQPPVQSTRQQQQQQRPPLLPLTIRTDEHTQSWCPTSTPDFNARDDNATVSGDSVSPSSMVVNRQHVEKVAPPEITKNVRRMFESGEIADRHQVPKRIVRIEDEMAVESSGVFENQPTVVADDVIRDTGEYVSPRSEVQPGMTKSLLSQWQAKGSEEFRSERRPIVLAEGEGVVLENQPTPQRPDVVREDYREPTAEMPTPGHARLLRERFTGNDGQVGPKKDAKAAVLAEMAAAAESGTPSVIENVPDRRPDDVAREEDTVEEVWLRKGYTRDLAGFWSTPKEDGGSGVPKAPIDLPKDAAGQSSVFENKPRALDETVVRGGEYVDEPVGVEKGRARTMAGMWQNRAGDTPVKPRAEPISLEREADRQGAGVYENAPVALEGVVRSTDQVEEIMGQRGLIRNIAEKFTGRQDSSVDSSGDRSRVGASPRRGPVPDMVVIDRADGPAVLENEPTQLRSDVVRSDASGYLDQPNVEPGMTRSLVASWKNKEIENNSPQVSTSGGRQLELDLAREAGVYENQPETRTDVVRADYDEPEMIPVAQMRSTRAMWTKKELEEQNQSEWGSSRKQPPEPVRFTPPRERTPPRVVQEDYRSYQSITLQSSAASTPGRQSPASGKPQSSPGVTYPSPSVRSPSDVTLNGTHPQHEDLSETVTKKSSAVLVFK